MSFTVQDRLDLDGDPDAETRLAEDRRNWSPADLEEALTPLPIPAQGPQGATLRQLSTVSLTVWTPLPP